MPCLDAGVQFSPLSGEGSFTGGSCALGLPGGFSWLNSMLRLTAVSRLNFDPRSQGSYAVYIAHLVDGKYRAPAVWILAMVGEAPLGEGV